MHYEDIKAMVVQSSETFAVVHGDFADSRKSTVIHESSLLIWCCGIFCAAHYLIPRSAEHLLL